MSEGAGTLYIVATPIGNLEDISRRALSVLANADLIAAEDTRHTGILLKHFGISRQLISFYSYNEEKRIPDLVHTLSIGKSIALVSDAGTPGISDPATRLVSAVVRAGMQVIPIPGPSAFLTALIASGLPTDRFIFEGFLPVKKGRATRIAALKDEERTIVLYESPHRLPRTLRELKAGLGERRVVLGRELTKKFEEFVRGTLSEAIVYCETKKVRGEFVIVLEGKPRHQAGV